MQRLALAALSVLSLLSLGTAEGASLNVGLAFDLGGRTDRGFNQAAYEGAKRAVTESGGTLQLAEPLKLSEVGQGIAGLAQTGSGLVIGVGFSNNGAISAAAKANPAAKFVTVDDLPTGPNTVGLRFREHEGSFLAGYLAGKQSATGRLGFIGGLNIPVINRFKSGFVAGVKFACPNCQVRSAYVGTTSEAFNNPKAAQSLAAAMMKNSVDIIYAAAGASGNGLIEQVRLQPCIRAVNLVRGAAFRSDAYQNLPKSAAYQKSCAGNSRPTFFIGVDVNQNALGDFDKQVGTLNHGLTSMLKRVDTAVYSVIRDVAQDLPWRAGDRSFGLSNGGVSLAFDQYNQALIPAAVRANLKAVEGLITSGAVTVPAK
ncbi:BMP family protein [Deinococcus oregonensis]|uniref:BMP family protein n=1 Tax=Deinococcus oregonensis TaxID=1805970 RepID=A0ABV6AX62_9DEIO